jgi:hypothetical protein
VIAFLIVVVILEGWIELIEEIILDLEDVIPIIPVYQNHDKLLDHNDAC